MPPALVAIVLVALGVPAAVRAASGRPRHLAAGWIAAFTAAIALQVLGEVSGLRWLMLGDAQVGLAALGALLAALAVTVVERSP